MSVRASVRLSVTRIQLIVGGVSMSASDTAKDLAVSLELGRSAVVQRSHRQLLSILRPIPVDVMCPLVRALSQGALTTVTLTCAVFVLNARRLQAPSAPIQVAIRLLTGVR